VNGYQFVMFQRRLKILIVLVLVGLAILVARLAWLQTVRAPQYAREAVRLLQRRPAWLETVRGSIYDVKGRLLAQDVPGYRLCLHYKLTRLYDERFLRYCHGSNDPENSAIGTREEFDRDRKQADRWLGELARICSVPLTEILNDIDRINDTVFVIAAARTRQGWYRTNNLACTPQPDGQAILDDLARVIPDEPQRLSAIFSPENEVTEMRWAHPVIEPIDSDRAFTIEERFIGTMLQGSDTDRPVCIKAEKMRRYIQGTSLCHIIGQLDPVQAPALGSRPVGEPDEQQRRDYYLGDRQGSWGIECVFEDYLRGSRGWEQRSLDEEIAPQRRIEPVYGSDVFLTVDIDLQEQIAAVIAGKNCLETPYYGSAVVIDVPTGQVRAMVSVPGFDLNSYYQYDQFKAINDENDPQNRKANRGLSVNYCPGSTIKPMILLGALEMALINGNTSFYCPGREPDKPPPQCWSIYGHGDLAAHRAICESCNSYFIQAGQLMGSQRVVDWLRLIGMGRCIMAWPEQIEADRVLTGFRETTGHIAPQGQDIPSGTTLRFMSIGRGALDGSILQIANNMATIARNGCFQRPVLVVHPKVDSQPVRIASLTNARIVQDAMKAVIYEPAGTAYKPFNPPIWPEQEVTLFGKTGSTENSLFGCFARAADGRCLAIAVVLDTEAHGTEVAAPLAADILRVCGRLGYLPIPAEITEPAPVETVGQALGIPVEQQ